MKLHCRIHSSGNLEELYKPPIIFLHGMALTGSVFKKVAPAIAEKTKRKAYVPDIRNHGKSPYVKEMDYDALTDDIVELMQQNNISKAILIGSSMGGRIAMNIALKHPHKVDALVVEDMSPRNVVSSGFNFVQIICKVVQDILNTFSPDTSLDEAKKNIYEFLAGFAASRVNKEKAMANYDADLVPLIKEGNMFKLECNIDVLTEMLEKDALVQNLPDLETTYDSDALFIYGSLGFFNLDADPTVKKLFPKATIRKVEGASHLVHVDSPEIYTDIITNFILHRNLPQSKY